MSAVPENLRYTDEHEWVRDEGDGVVAVGLTDFAQRQLGDVVFVELPPVGRVLAVHEELGTVESVKAVSEVYAPVAGEVTSVNEELNDEPELINTDPYDTWLVRIKLAAGADLGALLGPEAYRELLSE